MLTPESAQQKIGDLDKRTAELQAHHAETRDLLKRIENEIVFIAGQRALLEELLAANTSES